MWIVPASFLPTFLGHFEIRSKSRAKFLPGEYETLNPMLIAKPERARPTGKETACAPPQDTTPSKIPQAPKARGRSAYPG